MEHPPKNNPGLRRQSQKDNRSINEKKGFCTFAWTLAQTTLECTVMEFKKNNLFIWGTLLLFFGLQFHYFDSFVLTEKASSFYYDRFEKQTAPEKPRGIFSRETIAPLQRKTIQPPDWLGRCLISVGGVLVVQALLIRKEE
jgi:hypothetical protein